MKSLKNNITGISLQKTRTIFTKHRMEILTMFSRIILIRASNGFSNIPLTINESATIIKLL